MGIQSVNTPFPAVNNRLFPSIGVTSAAPGDVVPETGNGLGYFAQPPPGGYRIPGTMEGLGAIVPWPRIQTEWDLIQRENWSSPTLSGLGYGAFGENVDDVSGTVPTYVDPTPTNDQYWESRVAGVVDKIDKLIPFDALYASGTLAAAQGIANYWGSTLAADSRVVAALARLAKRHSFVLATFPGASFLPKGSTLPGGSGARSPIVIDYLDGSYAYAPGYGPVSQYGALQVANSSVPASPRISAYTGQTIGTASPNDIQPFSAGVATDPSTVPPPPSNYQGPLVTTNGAEGGSNGTGGATSGADSTLIPGVSNTMLLAGGGFLVLILAMGGRR